MNGISILTIGILLASTHVVYGAHDVDGKCLPGNRHKARPGPEDDSYKACHVFKNSSCCTSNFTNQLAVPVVQKIGTFSWTLCGNLSKRCQDFMVGVECFYSCSPYVGLWAHPDKQQAFKDAPVCSGYCDQWYEACKDDMTCAKNWLKDFNFTADYSNTCKRNCTTFKKMYTGGKDICESLWGTSFKYTKEGDGKCLHFKYNSRHNPNKDVVNKIFGSAAVQRQGCFVGVVLAVILLRVFL